MIKYELPVILRVSDDIEPLKTVVKEILEKYNVKIELEEPGVTKKLAYPIDGDEEGHYLFLTIESPPDSVTKIVNEFRLNTDILRYLFIKLKSKKSA